jgi:tRNA-specific 2-thiouridylase
VKVLCAMSGGVDSSVAAAELLAAGHEVVGVTMRLWGGVSDTGCCSIADVDDARRVAQQLGIDHLVFNFTDDFDRHVVDPYVDAHARGITPNPCIECNRHLKFDRLSERAAVLGFDAVATGHHARIAEIDGRLRLVRGHDDAKDQSYVLHMIPADELARTMFPVGHLTKDEVRARAATLGLRTASKPDSQDVCFISRARHDGAGGRETFLGSRIPFRPATVVDLDGTPVGSVDAVELVTVGQRRGIGLAGGGPPQYVVDVDLDGSTGPVVRVGGPEHLLDRSVTVADVGWTYPDDADRYGSSGAATVLVQSSAHGRVSAARVRVAGSVDRLRLEWLVPQRRIAPGQSVVVYDPSDRAVLAGGIATRAS